MKSPLQVISELGGSADSYITSVQFFAQQENIDKAEYERRIQEIIGLIDPPECESWFFARSFFMYVVQETIREFNNGIVPPIEEMMNDIYQVALEKATVYVESNPWNETRFNIEHGLKRDDEDVLEEGLIISTKKGAKKDLTERLFKTLKATGASRQKIIDAFVTQAGLSKAGATTYFHALKKEIGFSERDNPETETIKSENKQQLAERLYNESFDKSKPVIIALFIEKLKSSKLGAQTYFYACKKRFENATITN